MNHTELKNRIAGWLDQHRDEQQALLAALVRCPSDNPPGDCAPHGELVAREMEKLGFTAERHRVPDEVLARHGLRSVINVVVRERFGRGPTVALNAHGDVVPAGGGWSTDPYGAEIRDGWMYGRGSAVSKSDFATYAYALRALKDCGAPLAGTVELHFTHDEETGGLAGPGWLLSEGITRPDFAVCASFSYHVTIAHNGCLHLEVKVSGKSAHAARPDTGHDALEAATRILADLYAHRATLSERHSKVAGIDTPTLVVGLIEGGINTNVVPDEVTFRLDRRIIPEEQPEAVEAELRALIEASAAKLPGTRVGITQILLARPFMPIEGAERLADIFCREASLVMGEEVPTNGVPLYADARLYVEAGVPTIMYGAGPRTLLEANGHRADERVPVATLSLASKVVANAIVELLGTSAGPGEGQ
ncbi:M20/M25/M40 family metallo-hydrolase [Paraburkholderia sp. BL10I2N1]|uniref:M20/M25/M40 family metallo-hydrolase n=1 Tax=Paraburkholderia sp. BL10I2N1 TaxID=1938796 RepID=UPI0010CE2F99|nr:M20/M25/M40 family metallo-hydrolase [Paraburkholderia sp. BL10I2N1]TDN63341.1 acetylornithine deacetylase/succinyl-diaminopimelate desuccinylase-like protein [Paraburkholderia sp. BL10I2N1]